MPLIIGTYWYDDRASHTNGKFECVLHLSDGSYQVYEVKYLKTPINEDLYVKEKAKMMAVKDIAISSYGFVSSSGFSDKPDAFIAGKDLYSLRPYTG